ncbi:hypothetical protein KAR91_36185, partial [Candidatus Pacearchaeota archaeon]|nr:hypothetical protein [Candidatus Pacearchaeota archaeon]
VETGVFAGAKYPDGTPVASVAAWNEFGTVNIPERPAIRIAVRKMEKVIFAMIKKSVDPEKMVVDKRLGGLIGAKMQGAIQQSIVALSTPANAPGTIEAKKSSNPLIDTGLYLKSITNKVIA